MTIIFILIFLIALSLCVVSISIAPWVPTRKKDLARINHLSNLEPGQIFYDLGCGDGRVCFYIAKENPGASIIGVELFLPLYLWAKIKASFLHYKNLKITFGNVFNQDLSKADVIYVFARDKSINNRLKLKFEKELKKNAKVLSYVFFVEKWNKSVDVHKSSGRALPIYIYKF